MPEDTTSAKALAGRSDTEMATEMAELRRLLEQLDARVAALARSLSAITDGAGGVRATSVLVVDGHGRRRVELFPGDEDDETSGMHVFDLDGSPCVSLYVADDRGGPRHVSAEVGFGHNGDMIYGIGLFDEEPRFWYTADASVDVASHLFGG